jgi:hypothetical protein
VIATFLFAIEIVLLFVPEPPYGSLVHRISESENIVPVNDSVTITRFAEPNRGMSLNDWLFGYGSG